MPEEFESVADLLNAELGKENASRYMTTLVISDEQDYE